MRVTKPMLLGFLWRTYKRNGNRLALTGMVPFPFASPDNPVSEQEMWRKIVPEFPEKVGWDEGIPKDRGEVLFSARAYAPGRRPIQRRRVSIRVGQVAKELEIHGDRFWERHMGGWRPSVARSFLEMPIDFSRDFGGPGYPSNPIGKGYRKESGDEPFSLPNIESPFAPSFSPGEILEPTGLGALDVTWAFRYSKIGTYQPGETGTEPPALPSNADWTLYNQSLPDQWLPGFWTGGEPFRIEGLHPQSDLQEGRLPRILLRSFVTRSGEGGEYFFEVPMHPETVWFFPHLELGVVIHRGDVPIETDDASEVTSVLLAGEDPGDNRSASHYFSVQKRREERDPKDLSRYGDAPLLPIRLAMDPKANMADVRYHLANLPSNSSKRAKQILLEKIDQIQESAEKFPESMRDPSLSPPAGGGPDPRKTGNIIDAQNQTFEDMRNAVKNSPPQNLLEILEASIANRPDREAMSRQVDDRIKEAVSRIPDEFLQKKNLRREDLISVPPLQAPSKREVEAMCSLEGLKEKSGTKGALFAQEPPSSHVSDSENPASGIPSRIDSALSALNGFQGSLEALKKRARGLVRSVHFYPPPFTNPERAGEMRQQVIQDMGSSRNFRERELRGADLSGLDLSGCDFSEADLIGCDLSGATLSGAQFSGAWAAHARFSGCTLTKADFSGSNCGGADFSRAQGSHVNFSGTVLAGALFEECDLSDSRFDAADFSNVTFARSKVRNCDMPNARFLLIKGISLKQERVSLSDPDRLRFVEADFSGSRFEKALFMKVDFQRSSFEGSILSGATFLGCSGPETRFDRAILNKTAFPQSGDFSRSSFCGADMTGANLRGLTLQGADFSESILNGADGSGGNWQHAKISGCRAIQARFQKTDLKHVDGRGTDFRQALFLKADLLFADFRYASLYSAGFMGARIDDSTRWEHALTGKTFLEGQG